MSNGNESLRSTGPATAKVSGFMALTTQDVCQQIERIETTTHRLDDLGARLIGADQLPRNQREVAAKPTSDVPEAVRSETEQLTKALQRQRDAIEELQEIVTFLEQL